MVQLLQLLVDALQISVFQLIQAGQRRSGVVFAVSQSGVPALGDVATTHIGKVNAQSARSDRLVASGTFLLLLLRTAVVKQLRFVQMHGRLLQRRTETAKRRYWAE